MNYSKFKSIYKQCKDLYIEMNGGKFKYTDEHSAEIETTFEAFMQRLIDEKNIFKKTTVPLEAKHAQASLKAFFDRMLTNVQNTGFPYLKLSATGEYEFDRETFDISVDRYKNFYKDNFYFENKESEVPLTKCLAINKYKLNDLGVDKKNLNHNCQSFETGGKIPGFIGEISDSDFVNIFSDGSEVPREIRVSGELLGYVLPRTKLFIDKKNRYVYIVTNIRAPTNDPADYEILNVNINSWASKDMSVNNAVVEVYKTFKDILNSSGYFDHVLTEDNITEVAGRSGLSGTNLTAFKENLKKIRLAPFELYHFHLIKISEEADKYLFFLHAKFENFGATAFKKTFNGNELFQLKDINSTLIYKLIHPHLALLDLSANKIDMYSGLTDESILFQQKSIESYNIFGDNFANSVYFEQPSTNIVLFKANTGESKKFLTMDSAVLKDTDILLRKGIDKVATINERRRADGKDELSKETINTILGYREMLDISTEADIISRLQTAPNSVSTMDPGTFLLGA